MPAQRFFCCAILACAAFAQSVQVIPAPTVSLPTHIDGNSPSFWSESGFALFSSTGNPEMISFAPGQFGPWQSMQVDVSRHQHFPLWIEAAWRDDDGTVFGWYHHEPGGFCGSNGLTVPKIGAVVSYDGGRTIEDLGIVLESGDTPNCDSKNGFFAGGHGDFSVVMDREKQYFYFFFTNYAGDPSQQGIATARLAYEDRFHPAGAVRKFYQGEWTEPGIGGRMSPIYTAIRDWQREDTDSFWGPAVHWNTHVHKFVMLLNHACCEPGWPQEGIYISYHHDLANPQGWSGPVKIIDGEDVPFRPAFYPQVIGMGEFETDSVAGEWARLYVQGSSAWELIFTPQPPVLPEHQAEANPVDPPIELPKPLPCDCALAPSGSQGQVNQPRKP